MSGPNHDCWLDPVIKTFVGKIYSLIVLGNPLFLK